MKNSSMFRYWFVCHSKFSRCRTLHFLVLWSEKLMIGSKNNTMKLFLKDRNCFTDTYTNMCTNTRNLQRNYQTNSAYKEHKQSAQTLLIYFDWCFYCFWLDGFHRLTNIIALECRHFPLFVPILKNSRKNALISIVSCIKLIDALIFIYSLEFP